MTAQSESAFINTHREDLTCFWDRIKGRVLNWKSQYEWPKGVIGEAALKRRAELERAIRQDLAMQAYISRTTFESIMRWGFMVESGCSEEEIRRITRAAFQYLKRDRIAAAARELVTLPRIGISRAAKILALSDQNELGIYDSRSAHGLSDLVDSTGRSIVSIPPGRVIRSDNKSRDSYCTAFEKFVWVLRHLRRLAGCSEQLRKGLARVADLEIALFMRSKSGDIDLGNRPPKIPTHLRDVAEDDEESFFWTLGPGEKAKGFWVIFKENSATVLTGQGKTPKTLNANQVDACLRHFGDNWFPLSNSKTLQRRDSRGLGEYFARNFGSSVFASHFAALWVFEGRLEPSFRSGALWLRVLKK